MEYLTYGTIKTKVEKACGLGNETFFSSDEKLDSYNEAVNMAEADIHELYQDYFLTNADIALTSGTAAYSLPSDIYANKIRALVYNDGNDYYEVTKVPYKKGMFLDIEFSSDQDLNADYRYYIKNVDAATGMQLVLIPTSRVTADSSLKIYYIRNATKATEDASKCDIPEFFDFIVSHMKCAVYKKEGNPLFDIESAKRDSLRELMRDSLSKMIIDMDDEIWLDLSFYEDSYDNFEM